MVEEHKVDKTRRWGLKEKEQIVGVASLSVRYKHPRSLHWTDVQVHPLEAGCLQSD